MNTIRFPIFGPATQRLKPSDDREARRSLESKAESDDKAVLCTNIIRQQPDIHPVSADQDTLANTPPYFHDWHRMASRLSDVQATSPSAALALKVFLLNFLRKNANPKASNHTYEHRSVSPVGTLTAYHRDSYVKNPLIHLLTTKALEKTGSLKNPEDLLFMSSPQASRGVPERYFRLNLEDDAKIRVVMQSIIKMVANRITTDPRNQHRLRILANIHPSKNPLSPKETAAHAVAEKDRATQILEEQLDAFTTANPDTSALDLRFRVKQSLLFACNATLFALPTVLLPPYGSRDQHKEKVQHFCHTIIERPGFTPDMEMIARSLARFTSLSNILAEFGIQTKQVPETASTSHHKYHQSLDAFLTHPRVKVFGRFGRFHHLHPGKEKEFATHRTAAMHQLISGLQGRGLDEAFEAAGIHDVLKSSYAQVTRLMTQAKKNKDDMNEFLRFNDQIFEEILLWLMILKPYGAADLQSVMTDVMAPTLVDEPRPPQFSFFTSGSRACTQIIRAARTQLSGKKPTVMLYQDTYFEVVYDFNSVLQSDTNLIRVGAPFVLDPVALRGQGKINILIMDFSSDFQLSASDLTPAKPHDPMRIIHFLLRNGLADDQLTIVIDVTIDLINSDKIRHFLAQTRPLRKSGKLNVELYRSGQKLDQLGTDKLNCAYSMSFSEPTYFEKSRQIMTDTEFNHTSINYQALVHLNACAHRFLDEDRQMKMRNGTRVFNGIKPGHVVGPGNKSVVQFTRKDDDMMINLHVRFPTLDGDSVNQKQFAQAFFQYVLHLAKTNDWPIFARDSWGMDTTSVVVISDQAIRLSFGFETADTLDGYVDALNNIAEEMDAVRTDLKRRSRSPFMANQELVKYLTELPLVQTCKQLEAEVSENPNDTAGHYRLGQYYAKLTRQEEAISHFKEAIAQSPSTMDYYLSLSKQYTHNSSLRHDVYRDARTKASTDILSLKKLINMQAHFKDYRDCLKTIQTALSLEPEDKELQGMHQKAAMHRAYEYYQARDFFGAKFYFGEAAKITPISSEQSTLQLYTLLANCLIQENDHAEALPHLKSILNVAPNHTHAATLLANTYTILGQDEGLESTLLHITHHAVGDYEKHRIWMTLADFYDSRGQTENTRKACEKAIQFQTHSPAQSILDTLNASTER